MTGIKIKKTLHFNLFFIDMFYQSNIKNKLFLQSEII